VEIHASVDLMILDYMLYSTDRRWEDAYGSLRFGVPFDLDFSVGDCSYRRTKLALEQARGTATPSESSSRRLEARGLLTDYWQVSSTK